jgi:hypothetical protein
MPHSSDIHLLTPVGSDHPPEWVAGPPASATHGNRVFFPIDRNRRRTALLLGDSGRAVLARIVGEGHFHQVGQACRRGHGP